MLSLALLAALAAQPGEPLTLYVYATTLRIRDTPDGKVVGEVSIGTPCVVGDGPDGWAAVTCGAIKGFTKREMLGRDQPTAAAFIAQANDLSNSLGVRLAAGQRAVTLAPSDDGAKAAHRDAFIASQVEVMRTQKQWERVRIPCEPGMEPSTCLAVAVENRGSAASSWDDAYGQLVAVMRQLPRGERPSEAAVLLADLPRAAWVEGYVAVPAIMTTMPGDAPTTMSLLSNPGVGPVPGVVLSAKERAAVAALPARLTRLSSATGEPAFGKACHGAYQELSIWQWPDGASTVVFNDDGTDVVAGVTAVRTSGASSTLDTDAPAVGTVTVTTANGTITVKSKRGEARYWPSSPSVAKAKELPPATCR